MPAMLTKLFLPALLALGLNGAAQAADLTVSAAASLTDAFKEIAAAYEAQHPGTKVLLNFGASGALLQQIAKGAPVDVFASADEETMDAAIKQGVVHADARKSFARNSLVLIVPAASTSKFSSLAGLSAAKVQRIAIGNPASVPVGRYTQHALEAGGLWTSLTPKIVNNTNVRQALDYVARGEVDAGFVYGTDATLMRDKVRVALTVPTTTPISYPIAVTNTAAAPAEAKRFAAYVLSPAARTVLAKYGFRQP